MSDNRVAVLLNANAKRVSRAVQGAIANVLPPEDIYLSHSESDARRIAQTVVEQRYETVFTGGGDGTFMGFVNEIWRCSGRGRPLPRFGVLRLGTGNAIASVVGASPARGGRMLDDILRARAGQLGETCEIDLLEVEGTRCPFAGLGIDAHIVNSYAHVKRRYRSLLGRFAEGGLGYTLAVGGMTVPHYLTHRMPEAEIVNTGSTAFLLGPDGRPVGPAIEHGEPLYRGPVKIVAGSTVPNAGFDFRFFPFAGKRRGMMHLRVFSGSTVGVLTNLSKAFQGTYFPRGVSDFFCDSVEVRSNRPLPLQMGGDPKGERERLSIGMADRRIELLSFRPRALA